MLKSDSPTSSSGRTWIGDDEFFEVPSDTNSNSTAIQKFIFEDYGEFVEEPDDFETGKAPVATKLASEEEVINAPELLIDPQTLTTTRGALQNLGMVLAASLPVLGIAAVLRLINFGQTSAYMDEATYIVTGRTLIEHNIIYDNALQWTFGSLIYPLFSGWFDMAGGLNASRLLSVFWGLAMVQATIFTTLGLFKLHPTTKTQEFADFSLASKPVVASLLAGLVVAVLPTVNALSRFATYDAMAAGLFACGCAAFVWGWRENAVALRVGDKRTVLVVSLLVGAAILFFLAFLTKYVIAIYFPFLCILLLSNGKLRLKGLLGFIVPLSVACAAYYFLFADQLTKLLQFSHQYDDLRSDNILQVYILDRVDILVLLLLGYWGMRQAFRDNRVQAPMFLWGGALVIIIFQLITRADYDYWKHSVYIVLMLAPLAGWLWSDWSWWDEPEQVSSVGPFGRLWNRFKNSRLFGQNGSGLELFELRMSGNSETERAKSVSLALAVGLLLTAGGIIWSLTEVPKLLGHWPQLTEVGVANIRLSAENTENVLVDDTAINYYLYNVVPTSHIFSPFSFTYGNQSGLPAFSKAVQDQRFSLIILDGGATANGTAVWQSLQPTLKASTAYKLVYSEPLLSPNLDGSHTLEIYKLLKPGEQPASSGINETPVAPVTGTTPAAGSATEPTVPATAAPPAATLAPTASAATAAPKTTPAPAYPTNPAYNFDNGDEGWGLLPNSGPLEPGAGVSANDAFKLSNHNSLKFTPQADKKLYTVGVNNAGEFQKITMLVFIPADKADVNVRVGMYYFDNKWTWIDDGFQNEIVPGKWNLLTWELPAKASMQQFGLKLAGFSGSIYINGVTVE